MVNQPPHRLPKVRYSEMPGEPAKTWFFDGRLGQLRNVNNPNDFLDLNEFEVEYFKQRTG